MGVRKKGRNKFQHSGRSFVWWVENEAYIRVVSENKRFFVDYLILDVPEDVGGLLGVRGTEFPGLEEYSRPIVLEVPESIAEQFRNSMGAVVDAILTWSLDPNHEIAPYTDDRPNYLHIGPQNAR